MAAGLGMAPNEWAELRAQVDDSFWVMRVIGALFNLRSLCTTGSLILEQGTRHSPMITMDSPAAHISEDTCVNSIISYSPNLIHSEITVA